MLASWQAALQGISLLFMFMFRSTCFQAPFHVCAQIYVHMLRSTCQHLDLCSYAQIYMLALRSMFIRLDLCVYMLRAMLVCLDLSWLLCHVLLQPFLSLNISFSCFLALLVRCRSRSCGLGLHMHAQAYIKGFGSFPSHVHIFLLISMLYLHVCLSRSRLYHALCLLWACACVVASVPPRACLDVTTCEIHLHGVGMLDIHLFVLYVMLICLPSFLCFFASLHACLHVPA